MMLIPIPFQEKETLMRCIGMLNERMKCPDVMETISFVADLTFKGVLWWDAAILI
jgi:hypothetical protein